MVCKRFLKGLQSISQRFPSGFSRVSSRFPKGFQTISQGFLSGFSRVSKRSLRGFQTVPQEFPNGFSGLLGALQTLIEASKKRFLKQEKGFQRGFLGIPKVSQRFSKDLSRDFKGFPPRVSSEVPRAY